MTNAGKKHKPVGISKRTDKRAAARSIRARSSLSSCSTAASISTPGESPCNQAGSKDSRIMPSAMSPAPPSVSPCCPDRPRRFAPPKRAEWFIPAEAPVPAKAAHHASDHETPRNNDSPTRLKHRPYAPPTARPTTSRARGTEAPCRRDTCTIRSTSMVHAASATTTGSS